MGCLWIGLMTPMGSVVGAAERSEKKTLLKESRWSSDLNKVVRAGPIGRQCFE